MFLGVYDNGFSIEELTGPYVHHKEKNAECFFIGEILSGSEETYNAFQQFKKDKKPEQVLFLKGNYQTIITIYNQMWLFSDLGNLKPIYYTIQNHCWMFSSHLSDLNKKVTSPFNNHWFCRNLSTFGFHIELETPFQKINSVPGGFGLHVNKQEARIFQAWDVDRESTLSLEEASEQLREELTAAVLIRCQNKRIGSDLSGGLDSSTLAWIASNDSRPVKALTIIGKEENEDIRIARSIAKDRVNIEHIELSQNDIPLIYSDMDKIQTDIPIPSIWSANKVKKKLSLIKQFQSEIYFSGEGGDSVVGASFSYLVDLVQQGKWGTFLAHANGWAKEKRESPWTWISGSLRNALRLPFRPKQRHPLSTAYNQANWFHFSTIVKKRQFSKQKGLTDTNDDIH
jgi:asparagine synthase (glutamine-hydrolysing)